MKTLRAISALCLVALSFLNVNGQSSLIPKYEIGVHIGSFIYQGDLTPIELGAFNTMKPGFGISGTRNINSLYAVRLQFLRGWLKGDDSKYDNPAWRQQRNFNFKTPVTELSALLVRNITGLIPNEAGIINFSPYVFGGISYSFLKIKRDWSQFNYSHFAAETAVVNGLTEDINHKVPKGIFSIPIGFGVRYGITEKLSFSLEGTYRILDTDYLDGFSQAANPDKNDHYHTLMAGLIYSFGKRNRFDCPVIKN
jgi:opacity protein-like surface antigen